MRVLIFGSFGLSLLLLYSFYHYQSLKSPNQSGFIGCKKLGGKCNCNKQCKNTKLLLSK